MAVPTQLATNPTVFDRALSTGPCPSSSLSGSFSAVVVPVTELQEKSLTVLAFADVQPRDDYGVSVDKVGHVEAARALTLLLLLSFPAADFSSCPDVI